MEDLINEYVEDVFTPELQDEINRSFGLFDFYNYDLAFPPLTDVLMNASFLDPETKQDQFILKINEALNYVLQEHQIKLHNTATIMEKNEILLALAHIQNLEDYTGIIRTLEGFEPDEVQLSSILQDLCMLDQYKIMELLEFFNPSILRTLKQFIYQKEESKPDDDAMNMDLVKHFKFFSGVFGEANLGTQMVRSQLRVGERFETYIDFIQDNVIGADDSATALNILSVIYLSVDGYNSPLLTYRKHSYSLLQDINVVTRVEIKILEHIQTLTSHLQAAKEKASRNNEVIHVSQ